MKAFFFPAQAVSVWELKHDGIYEASTKHPVFWSGPSSIKVFNPGLPPIRYLSPIRYNTTRGKRSNDGIVTVVMECIP